MGKRDEFDVLEAESWNGGELPKRTRCGRCSHRVPLRLERWEKIEEDGVRMLVQSRRCTRCGSMVLAGCVPPTEPRGA